jgi:hypothetical protein
LRCARRSQQPIGFTIARLDRSTLWLLKCFFVSLSRSPVDKKKKTEEKKVKSVQKETKETGEEPKSVSKSKKDVEPEKAAPKKRCTY